MLNVPSNSSTYSDYVFRTISGKSAWSSWYQHILQSHARGVPPFSIAGWSITRDTTDLQSAHPHSYPTIPWVLLKKYETVASGQHGSVSQHSPYIKHTKTELFQSQNLLLTFKKLWLHQPWCLSKTVSHTCNWSPKQGADGTECKNWFSYEPHQWNECHLIYSIPFPISHKLICQSLGSLKVLS